MALQDAQRALRIVRSREKDVSVLGFSAGGHLMGMAVTRADFRSYPEQDSLDRIQAYADRAALIYPVITLESPYTHTSTHKVLVGPHAGEKENAEWSVQNFVTSQTPPVFLVQAEDDPIPAPETFRYFIIDDSHQRAVSSFSETLCGKLFTPIFDITCQLHFPMALIVRHVFCYPVIHEISQLKAVRRS